MNEGENIICQTISKISSNRKNSGLKSISPSKIPGIRKLYIESKNRRKYSARRFGLKIFSFFLDTRPLDIFFGLNLSSPSKGEKGVLLC